MYAAHDAPAASASPRPARSILAQGVLVIPAIRTTPTPAPATASQVLAPVGQHRGQDQGADELDGDYNADRYPGQRAVEEEVHHRQDHPEGADHQPVGGGATSQPGSHDGEQDGSGDGQAQCH